MRLGQLSRKLNIRTSDIIEFLSPRGIAIEDHVNSKIEDEHVRIVVNHFAPELNEKEIRQIENAGESESASADPKGSDSTMSITSEKPSLQSQATESGIDPNRIEEYSLMGTDVAESDKSADVIKAPKIELQGLKVLGKIELPQPKKKTEEGVSSDAQPSDQPSDSAEGKVPRENKKNRRHNSRSSEPRPRKNPIALQREQEEKEAAERKREDARVQKEKRAEYYHKRVRPTPPVRAAKLVNEPLVQLHEEPAEPPKSWWGRFIKWLTS